MTTKKYEILKDQTMQHEGRTLYRIRRLSDGKIGGWIEKEYNLAQEGNCFVYHSAKVFDDANVWGGAFILDNAWVYDRARVGFQACVCGDARVGGKAIVSDFAHVGGMAMVIDNAIVGGHAKVLDDAIVRDDAKVFGYARVENQALVRGTAIVEGWLFGDSVASAHSIAFELPKPIITLSDNIVTVGKIAFSLRDWKEPFVAFCKELGCEEEKLNRIVGSIEYHIDQRNK
jgi:carbonic anhydrase/acetyltransferase-like protein (isoleucine patch superfamily)